MPQPDWNPRFAETEFAYGTEPNSFLADNANLLTNPVLSIVEGEGRNAVFLATIGLNVHAVDSSHVSLAKAEGLAASRSVAISTEVADLQTLHLTQSLTAELFRYNDHFFLSFVEIVVSINLASGESSRSRR